MFSPAAERNKDPIRKALHSLLPQRGLLLELACGSLQHACHIAPDHPELLWQPTDIDADAIAHGQQILLPDNVHNPIHLNALEPDWPIPKADILYAANLLHISDPAVIRAVFRRGQSIGVTQAFIYGPFMIDGQHTSPGNRQFDADLRRRDPGWGIRDLDEVAKAASAAGFELTHSLRMPANNLLLHFTRAT